MNATFGTHSELITTENHPTFKDIKRESSSGLLVLTIKRERVNSDYRSILLPRDFEENLKVYIDRMFNGSLDLTKPLLASKSGSKPIQPGDLNRIIMQATHCIKNLPTNGLNLNSVRYTIVLNAIISGANIYHITNASGAKTPKAFDEKVLPIHNNHAKHLFIKR